jgi:membrane protease YdiL (CAAX protease family)
MTTRDVFLPGILFYFIRFKAMMQASKSFTPEVPSGVQPKTSAGSREQATDLAVWLQLALAYGLIEAALWTRQGRLDFLWIGLSALCILSLTLGSRFSKREMGITVPPAVGIGWTVAVGVALALAIPLVSSWLGADASSHALPFHAAWQYAVWALAQQFIVQSFFYVRMEAILGGRWAVLAAAVLFGAAHIPNPVLTLGSFVGGLFFCEMFRRYRSIFPLGMVHAMLGLTIAASFSDGWLHHMRVGAGYGIFHP